MRSEDVTWGQYVADARRRRGYSQSRLASEVGVTRETVSRWENAAHRPDGHTVAAVARVLRLDVDEALIVARLKSAEPSAVADEEIERVLTSKLPQRIKAQLVEFILRQREADAARLHDEIGRMMRLVEGE